MRMLGKFLTMEKKYPKECMEARESYQKILLIFAGEYDRRINGKFLFHIFYTDRSKREHDLPAIIKTDTEENTDQNTSPEKPDGEAPDGAPPDGQASGGNGSGGDQK